MNHDVIKEVLRDQHEVIRRAQIVPREYTFEEEANNILVGLRRAGKSTLLYKRVRDLIADGVEWKQIIYINFEDERLAEFQLKDFNDIVAVQSELSGERGFYFFDEIQNIDGWEKFARRLADSSERVEITGSNAKMLGRDMESTLGGRYLTKFIEPYSFSEFLRANNIELHERQSYSTRERGRINAAMDEYLRFGGFPEAIKYEGKREYLASIYQKILLGDIVARNKIRNDQALRILVKKVAESVCTEISFSSLQNAVRAVGVSISKDTVIEYIGHASDAYLLFTVNNFAAKFAEREGNPKYYFGDNGLLMLFLRERDSALLENLVALLLRKQYPDDLYFLHSSKTGVDIDFYLPEAGLAIQVAWSIAGPARAREVNSLLKLSRTDKSIKRFIIVTMEEEDLIEEGGTAIEVIPIVRLLVNGIR